MIWVGGTNTGLVLRKVAFKIMRQGVSTHREGDPGGSLWYLDRMSVAEKEKPANKLERDQQ